MAQALAVAHAKGIVHHDIKISRFLFCVPLTSVQQERLRVALNWDERLPPSR